MKHIITFFASLTCMLSATAQQYTYIKVSEEPSDWSGEYLIVRELDDVDSAMVFNGSLEELDSKDNTIKVYCPHNEAGVRFIADNEETTTATFTIAKSETEGAYTIQSHSGYWIGYNKADAIDANLKADNTKSYDNTITLEDGKTNVNIISSNGFYLRYNDDITSNRFRYYEAGKKKSIKLYKKTVSESTAICNKPIIDTNEVYYDLSGRKVSKPTSGVYITSKGRKIVIK